MEDTNVEEIVEQNMTELLDFFMVVGRIQNEIWSTLPPATNNFFVSLDMPPELC